MIISSKSNKQDKKIEKFPILMSNTEWDFVVLFTSEYHGIVVYSTDSDRPIGYEHGCQWISCFDKDVWKEFDGNILLTNGAI